MVSRASKQVSSMAKRLLENSNAFSWFSAAVNHSCNCSPVSLALTASAEGGPKLLSASNLESASSRSFAWSVAMSTIALARARSRTIKIIPINLHFYIAHRARVLRAPRRIIKRNTECDAINARFQSR